MRIKISTRDWKSLDCGLVCLPVNQAEGKKKKKKKLELPEPAASLLAGRGSDFSARAGECLLLYPDSGPSRLLYGTLRDQAGSRPAPSFRCER